MTDLVTEVMYAIETKGVEGLVKWTDDINKSVSTGKLEEFSRILDEVLVSGTPDIIDILFTLPHFQTKKGKCDLLGLIDEVLPLAACFGNEQIVDAVAGHAARLEKDPDTQDAFDPDRWNAPTRALRDVFESVASGNDLLLKTPEKIGNVLVKHGAAADDIIYSYGLRNMTAEARQKIDALCLHLKK